MLIETKSYKPVCVLIPGRVKQESLGVPTHGSLTKAGKVRFQTPKVKARERKSPIPKYRVRRNYEKRVLHNREPGQSWGRMGRGRRRGR